MAEILIVDAHVHLWNPEVLPIPWLVNAPRLKRPYELKEFHEQTAGQPVVGMVYVEVDVAPQFALLEARRVVALAQQDARLGGIVAAAPLEFGEQTRPYLDALRDLGPLIKGVRRNLQDERDPEFCLRPAFMRGMQLLADYGFSFDICIRHHQLPAVTELVRRTPDVAFVLDHLGKPDIRNHRLQPWQGDLARLAALPNVCAKLSGLLTEADPQQWQLADLRPYVDHALAVFGPQRLLFGGDWPVMTRAGTYAQWVESVLQLITDLPETDQHAIWHANAQKFYHVDVTAS